VTQAQAQCSACRHFRSAFSVSPPAEDSFCAAFPGGIPDKVYGNELDHRQPIAGDNGIHWESNGQPFPEYALATPA